MEEFNPETIRNEDIKTALEEVCSAMTEDMKPLVVNVTGEYEEKRKLITFKVKSMDNEQIHDSHLRLFFDMLSYLSIDKYEKFYSFDLYTFANPAFTDDSRLHHYHLETSMDLIPDSGEITRKEWEKFVSQLVYTLDGKPQVFPNPGPFYDEIEESTEDSKS
jgi:hypothetical protein